MPATATRRVPSRPRQAAGAAPLAALPLAALNLAALNLAGLLLALAPLAAHAQGRASASSPAGGAASVAAAESASAARAAWRRAGEAMRARNPDSARRELARASAAWPTQPAYAWMLARMSAAAGDTASVAAALGHVASLGLTGDLKSDTTLARVAASPALAATVARLEENAREIARSRAKLTLPDSTFWPEGIDHDARTGAWYVTSIRHRTVAEVGADGRVRELWPREAKGIGAVFGVRVDPREPVLWVTTAAYAGMSGFAPEDSSIAALLKVRIADGAVLRRWDLGGPAGKSMPGDLAVGPRGDVFVSVSDAAAVLRLRPGADSLERITSPLFLSPQGIAPAPDGRAIYVADYSHGIMRVDLDTHAVSRLDDAPGSTSLGMDGFAWDRGSLVGVQNGIAPARVVRFRLSPEGARIAGVDVLERNTTAADEPTTAVVVGRELVYVANSQFEKYDARGQLRRGAVLRPPVLLSLPLDP